MTEFNRVTPRLPTTDLERTVVYYREAMDFEVDVSWPEERPTFVILRRDETFIAFFESQEPPRGPPGYAELYIDVRDIQELYHALRERVPIEWGPEVYSYGRREFAVRDPDGYLVIFTEPTTDPPTTAEPG